MVWDCFAPLAMTGFAKYLQGKGAIVDLIGIKKSELPKICKKDDIVFLGVFGSFARGESTEDSDIDLLVRFSNRKSLLDIVRIERELSFALGRRVDLLTEKSISPYIKDRIKAELQVIYEQ